MQKTTKSTLRLWGWGGERKRWNIEAESKCCGSLYHKLTEDNLHILCETLNNGSGKQDSTILPCPHLQTMNYLCQLIWIYDYRQTAHLNLVWSFHFISFGSFFNQLFLVIVFVMPVKAKRISIHSKIMQYSF